MAVWRVSWKGQPAFLVILREYDDLDRVDEMRYQAAQQGVQFLVAPTDDLCYHHVYGLDRIRIYDKYYSLGLINIDL